LQVNSIEPLESDIKETNTVFYSTLIHRGSDMDFINEGISRTIESHQAEKIAHDAFHHAIDLKAGTDLVSIPNLYRELRNLLRKEKRFLREYFVSKYDDIPNKRFLVKEPNEKSNKRFCLMFLLSSVQQNCASCTRYLLENIADLNNKISKEDLLNQTNLEGLTPLHIAAKNTHQACINLILEHASQPIIGQTDVDGKIPLYYAISNGANESILQCLGLESFRVIADLATKWSVIHFAISNYLSNRAYNSQMLKSILEQIDQCTDTSEESLLNQQDYYRNNYTPLHMAIEHNKLEVATLLLERGANIDAHANNQHTPLNIAIFTNNLKAAQLLLEYGANINSRDDKDRTPLHHAICYNHHTNSLKYVKFLLDKGADPNATDYKKRTPLHKAIRYDYLKAIQALLYDKNYKKTVLNISDYKGLTILHTAIYYHQILENLARMIRQAYKKHPELRNTMNQDGYTPLHLAVSEGNSGIVNVFLEQEERPICMHTVNPKNGKNLFHTAMEHALTDINKCSSTLKVLKYYHSKEDISTLLNTKDNSGKSPLDILKLADLNNQQEISSALNLTGDLDISFWSPKDIDNKRDASNDPKISQPQPKRIRNIASSLERGTEIINPQWLDEQPLFQSRRP